ncbi:hypothetical protein KVT40_001358 [Elsinoe batatas]|uniref:Uncharacterized protein n=1 Tax=Elsinoe batatas TaxID=2601811 RepID=A0A8K0L774_9PEZI|nr:hypothetical protein KVT40_001358 [Elsinoe batatas]
MERLWHGSASRPVYLSGQSAQKVELPCHHSLPAESVQDASICLLLLKIVTKLKPGQNGKGRFDGLTLAPYYNGVYENYDILAMKPAGIKKDKLQPLKALFYGTGSARTFFFDFRAYQGGPESSKGSDHQPVHIVGSCRHRRWKINAGPHPVKQQPREQWSLV